MRSIMCLRVLGSTATLLLCLTGNVLAKPSLHLVADNQTGTWINVEDGLCYPLLDKYSTQGQDCNKSGVYHVLSLRESLQHDHGLPVASALELLRRDACPLHWSPGIAVQVLGESCDEQAAAIDGCSTWVDIRSLQEAGATDKLRLKGLLLGSELVSTLIADLCFAAQKTDMVEVTAVQRRQMLQQNSTSQGYSVAVWDYLHNSDYLSTMNVVPMPTELTATGAVKAVATGAFHSVAVTANDSVVVWGTEVTTDTFYSMSIHDEVNKVGVASVAAGSLHTCAVLQGSGKVVCWGVCNDPQQSSYCCAVPPVARQGVQTIRILHDTTFAKFADGTWFAWDGKSAAWLDSGFNMRTDIADVAQDTYLLTGTLVRLTNGTLLHHGATYAPPASVPNGSITAICCGAGYALAALSNGTLVGWGSPAFSQAWQQIPQHVQGQAATVACGPAYVVAQLANGTTTAWGGYAAGRKQISAADLPAGNVSTLAVGVYHSVYLLKDQFLIQEGSPPPPIQQLTDVINITQSNAQVITGAVRQNGSLVIWGDMFYNIADPWWYGYPAPAPIEGDSPLSLAIGNTHMALLLQSGRVQVWGNISAPMPAEVEAGGASAVAAGIDFTLALKADPVYAWGNVPADSCSYDILTVPEVAMSNVVQISGSYDHALALLTNGTAVAWGCNEYGQAEVPMVEGGFVAVSAGASFSLGMPKVGPVIGWGVYTTFNTPTSVSADTTIMMSAGNNYAMALLNNRSVIIWDNFSEVLPSPSHVNIQENAAVSAGFASIALYTLANDNTPPSQPPLSRPPLPPTPPPASEPAGVLVGWGKGYVALPLPPPVNVTVEKSVVSSAAGQGHAVALHESQQVTVWGDNSRGQLQLPNAVHDGRVRAISAGDDYSLALMESGQVLCWGNDWPDSTDSICNGITAFSSNNDVQAVIAGSFTSYFQKRDGSWVAWGGIADDWSSMHLDTLSDIVDIADCGFYFFVLFSNGSVVKGAWGEAGSLQIASATPVMGANITAICCNWVVDYVLAVDTLGRVWAWGETTSQAIWNAVPDNIQGQTRSLACGDLFASVKLDDGSFAQWGLSVPQGLVPAQGQAVAAGSGFTLYLTMSGNVQQTGILTVNNTGLLVPPNLGYVRAVSASSTNTVALMADGSAVAWGSQSIEHLPAGLLANSPVTAVAAGPQHVIAVLQSGLIVQWGSIDTPQTPAQVKSADIRAVAAGYDFSLALTEDNSVLAWAVSTSIACPEIFSIPSTIQSNAIAVSAGNSHALALLSNGSVVTWGCEFMNLLEGVHKAAMDVTAIAAGPYYSMVLLSSGEVVAWGDDYYSQTRVPVAAQTNVVAIAAGAVHAAALLSNGTIVTWGSSGFESPNVPSQNVGIEYFNVPGRALAVTALDIGTLAIIQPAPPPPLQPATPHAPMYPAPGPVLGAIVTDGASHETASSNGKLAGIIAASASAALILIAAAALYAWHRHKQAKTGGKLAAKGTWQPIASGIDGLKSGEMFARSTAHEHTWCDGTAVTYATPLLASNDNTAIQLSKEEVQQQILLVKDGLLGRGATALVFKCLWPDRFGGNALLAAKVLKDGYEPDIATLQSFYYEATVLAGLNPPHANVVRLYGYCWDTPNVCLILELLPGSLKSMLYKTPSVEGLSSSGLEHKDQQAVTTRPTFVTSSSDTELLGSTSSSCTTYITIHDNATSSSNIKDVEACTADINLGETAIPTLQHMDKKLSMLQVLRISLDIAAGLRYLHDMPLVVEAAGAQATETRTLLNIAEETDTFSSDQHQSQSMEATPARQQKTTKVVHRDLKPANILIAPDGTAKISDFGLARQQLKTTMVTEHLAAGTLPYMAPELLVSVRVGSAAIPATNRVDIYSIAMIMWEMLSGCVPWSHLNEPSMLAAVMSGRRPELPMESPNKHPITVPLSEVPASLHAMPEFNMIIRACWNQREHKRPTAAALYDMLLALLQKYEPPQK